MSKTYSGRFCTHCSKTVVDFTLLTDSEVLNIIKQNSGKLCGRLIPEQINRVMQLNNPANNSLFHKILAGLLLVGTSENAIAIGSQQIQQNNTLVVYDNETALTLTETKSEPTLDTLKNTVQGSVIDSNTKEPLMYASIRIEGTTAGTMTNPEGEFKLLIPDSLMTDKIHLVISSVGYPQKKIVLNKEDLAIKNHLILATERDLKGEIEIVTLKKKKWWQRKK